MKSVISLKKRQNILTLSMLLGAVFAFTSASFASFAEDCSEKSSGVLRIHILANSDSDEDQRFKYLLRDFIISQTEDYLSNADTLEEAKQISAELLGGIEASAKAFMSSQLYEHDVKILLENMYFTTRTYENITMPAGNYDTIRVVIGAGEGRNWWCVAFPPLCLPVVSGQGSEAYFTPEASRIIESGGKVAVRFKTYEWFTKLFARKS